MTLFKSAKDIAPISSTASQEYKMNQDNLRRLVDAELASFPGIHQIIGHNPFQVMYDNHYYHAAFMGTVFTLNNYELLARIFVWIYRAYGGRGFQDNYFVVDLQAWQQAIDKLLTKESAYEIKAIYKWLADHHDDLISLAISDEYHIFSNINMAGINYTFLMHLLHGDYKARLAMTEGYLKETNDLTALYVQVIQPCLYEMGRLWEGGHVSVDQEHLATAIASRIMLASSASGLLSVSDCSMGTAIIICAPGELHELGSRMVADLLESDGWRVDFFGTSLTTLELVSYLQSCPVHFIGITASIPVHIDSVGKVIEAIRQNLALQQVKIMVGGPAFHHEDRSWRLIGADAYAVDGVAAVEIAKKWWSIKE